MISIGRAALRLTTCVFLFYLAIVFVLAPEEAIDGAAAAAISVIGVVAVYVFIRLNTD